MKNTIYIVVIVLCLILAGAILKLTRSGGSGGGIQNLSGTILVKCNNPSCGAVYEIEQEEFNAQIRELAQKNLLLSRTPALICKKCGKQSAFQAVRCEKCDNVFFYGYSNDFPDKCPKCSYSKMEAGRKAEVAGKTQ